MRKKLLQLCWLLTFLLVSISFADVQVRDVSVKSRYPWNGMIDITYSILCGETDKGEELDVYVAFMGYDAVLDKSFPMKSLTGQGATAPVKTGGPYTVTWDAAKDYPTINSSRFQVKIHATVNMYMVVDLSGGPNAEKYPVRYSKTPPDLDEDTCRTTELWLRRIPAGTFLMGSPEDELGHRSDETLHEVTITKPFYIGVFECTQMQYQLVMGYNPSIWKGDCRPVEALSFNAIRGPNTNEVDASTFMGRIRAKTGLPFELPSEAQWEYACRAGTTTALNSGKNLEPTTTEKEDVPDANVAEVARYAANNTGRFSYVQSDGKGGYEGHTKVGCYMPNAWGLYDMHGNGSEWCLDWYGEYGSEPVIDPVGPKTGTARVIRGTSYYAGAIYVRSAIRDPGDPTGGPQHYSNDTDNGFRLMCPFVFP